MPISVLQVLQRAADSVSPAISPFKAIWGQWEARGAPSGEKGLYLQAEDALKRALADLGERNIPEFARSGSLGRYAAALKTAIRNAERQGS